MSAWLILLTLENWFFCPNNFIAFKIPFLNPISCDPPSEVSIVLQYDRKLEISLLLKEIIVSKFWFSLSLPLSKKFFSNILVLFEYSFWK